MLFPTNAYHASTSLCMLAAAPSRIRTRAALPCAHVVCCKTTSRSGFEVVCLCCYCMWSRGHTVHILRQAVCATCSFVKGVAAYLHCMLQA